MPVSSFTGEIVMVPYTFTPRYFIDCDGALVSISQNPVLYSVMGSIYGGDDYTYFMTPNFKSRIPIHSGNGPGLSFYSAGMKVGLNEVTLSTSELPEHSHDLDVLIDGTKSDDVNNPANTLGIGDNQGAVLNMYSSTMTNVTALAGDSISYTGTNSAHENRQPNLALRFIICADGIYPQRS